MILNMQCEKCGSPVLFDNSREFMFCWSCGNKIFNPGPVLQSGQQLMAVPPAAAPVVPVGNPVYPPQYYYNGPNLIVSYQSNSSFPLLLFIHSTKERFYIDPGQTLSLRLNQGRHALFFGFGSKYYRRDIRILL